MNEHPEPHDIEQLVEAFLDHKARVVDGNALWTRVLRTRRRRRLRRRIITVTAAAAVIAIAATGILRTRKGSPVISPSGIGNEVARIVQDQQEHAIGGVETVMSRTNVSLTETLDGLVPERSPTDSADFGMHLNQIKASLDADAKVIQTKVKTLVSYSLGKAGLLI